MKRYSSSKQRSFLFPRSLIMAGSRFMAKQPEMSRPSRHFKFSITSVMLSAVIRFKKRRQSFFKFRICIATTLITESSTCLVYERSSLINLDSDERLSDRHWFVSSSAFLMARSSSEYLDLVQTLLKDLSERKLCVEPTPTDLILKVWYSRFWLSEPASASNM